MGSWLMSNLVKKYRKRGYGPKKAQELAEKEFSKFHASPPSPLLEEERELLQHVSSIPTF